MIYQQYKGTNIEDLAKSIVGLYNKYIYGAINEYYDNIYNIENATGIGLDIWGELLGFPRNIGKKGELEFNTLTDEQYRIILKYMLLRNNAAPTIENFNHLLEELFEVVGTEAYVSDNTNMSITISININIIPEWLLFIFETYDLLPRGMGVGIEINKLDYAPIGFKGQNLHNFYHSYFKNSSKEA